MSITPQPEQPGVRRPSGLAYVVIAAFVLTIAVAIWSLVVDLGRASYVSSVLNGAVRITDSAAAHQDDRVRGAAVATLLTLVVTGAVFITWFAILVRRLHAGRPGMFRHRPGWAIGGWFVPFLNFVRPKQMLDDAWRAAADGAKPVPGVFHAWWGLYLTANLVSIVGGRIAGSNPNDAHALMDGDRISGAGDALWAIAAVLGIVVVAMLDVAARRAGPAPEPAASPQLSWPQPAPGAAAAMVFNPPPGWPAPPPGWIPPPGWQPDPAWPPAPPTWRFWVPINPT